MRYLLCSKSIRGTTSQCQKLQIQVKPPPKIHIVDFKRIEEEKHKKNGISKLLVFKTKKNYTKENDSSCN
jgi:hypothetical protein